MRKILIILIILLFIPKINSMHHGRRLFPQARRVFGYSNKSLPVSHSAVIKRSSFLLPADSNNLKTNTRSRSIKPISIDSISQVSQEANFKAKEVPDYAKKIIENRESYLNFLVNMVPVPYQGLADAFKHQMLLSNTLNNLLIKYGLK